MNWKLEMVLLSSRIRQALGLPLVATALCLVTITPLFSFEKTQPTIVALGDVHGNLEGLKSILREVDLVSDTGTWIGKNSILVQTGDFLDRGEKCRRVMDFLMELEEEAETAGGRVEVLLGNHEVMNLMGDLRYVTDAAFATFADEKSEKRRQELLKKTVRFLKKQALALRLPEPEFDESWEASWLKEHPLGFVEQRRAFDRKGQYGKWLRGLRSVVRIDNFVFLHGGLAPQVTSLSLEEINKRIRNELRAFDNYRRFLSDKGIILPEFTQAEMLRAVEAELEFRGSNAFRPRDSGQSRQETDFLAGLLELGKWLTLHPNGPLWFRGYAVWEEAQADEIEKVTQNYGAAHFVVGHTPQLPEGRIRTRFGGKILLIDTGMNGKAYPGGRPAALEIRGGRVSAVYLGERVTLLEASAQVLGR